MSVTSPARALPLPSDELILIVEGVNCGGCISKIAGTLKKLPGMQQARLNFTNRRLTVAFDREHLSDTAIISAIDAIGYRAFPFEQAAVDSTEDDRAKWLLRCLAVAGLAAMTVMLLSVSI